MSKGSSTCSVRNVSTQAAALSVALNKTSPLPSPTFMSSSPVDNRAGVETLTTISTVKFKQVHEDCDGTVAEQSPQSDSTEKLTGDSERGITSVEVQGAGRYEYMDIRQSEATDGEDQAWEGCGSQTSGAQTEKLDQIVELLKKGHKAEEEDMNCHNTSKQPTLEGNLGSMVIPKPDVLTAGVEKLEEYEEMTKFGVVSNGWEQADYQNLPVMGRAVCEEMGSGRCVGIRGYIKVCAGMGEPGSNTSFDNPDYWHSRLFLKPDAVRT